MEDPPPQMMNITMGRRLLLQSYDKQRWREQLIGVRLG